MALTTMPYALKLFCSIEWMLSALKTDQEQLRLLSIVSRGLMSVTISVQFFFSIEKI